jgi:hypothetical protein
MYSHKMAAKWPDKKPVTILTLMCDNNGMMDQERQTGKQGNQSRKQSLSLIITNVWGDGQNGPAA